MKRMLTYSFKRLHKNKYPEFGRTLLEMLGVLAIISVLTIAGLRYYKYTITQVHANDIMENVYKRTALYKGSAYTAGMYKDQLHTAYYYGIRDPESRCSTVMIRVGQISEDNTAITPDLCKEVVSRVSQEKKLKAVYNDCEKIKPSNIHQLCATAKILDIEIGDSTSHLFYIPSTPDTPPPAPEPEPDTPADCGFTKNEDCDLYHYLNMATGCCEPCPANSHRETLSSLDCKYCLDERSSQCCNPKDGTYSSLKNCEVCVNKTEVKPWNWDSKIKCQTCDPDTGEIKDKTSADLCKVCDPNTGKFVPKTSTNKCETCDPSTGDIVAKTSTNKCEICDPDTGNFVAKTSGNKCETCDPDTGDFVAKTSTNKCKTCNPNTGSFVDIELNKCQACNPNQGIYDTTPSACQTCDPETGAITPEKPKCKICDETSGTWIDDVESEGCTQVCNVKHWRACEDNQILDEETHCCVDCPEGLVRNKGDRDSLNICNCRSNADCQAGEFCCLTVGIDGAACKVNYEDSRCRPNTMVPKSTSSDLILSELLMSHQAAENWCASHGKQLIPLTAFGCYRSNTGCPYTGKGSCDMDSGKRTSDNWSTGGACCSPNQWCPWNVQGGVREAIEEGNTNYSASIRDLYSTFSSLRGFHAWTSTLYDDYRCHYFTIDTLFGDLSHSQGTGNQSSNGSRALCR